MANVARSKTIEENITNASEATDGIATGYSSRHGFAFFAWPAYMTVDLEDTYDLHTIRFLLWDKDGRQYRYRLLTSQNHQEWQVHFDTGDSGSSGWQEFQFDPPVKARYVRIHGLWNSSNREFHVVEVEAHDTPPPPLTVQCPLSRVVKTKVEEKEIGDAFPLTKKLYGLASEIESLVKTNERLINPETFLGVINELRSRFADVSAIEQNMEAIRREITGPVVKELDKASKLGKFSVYGFWVGSVGGVLAIISILMNLF